LAPRKVVMGDSPRRARPVQNSYDPTTGLMEAFRSTGCTSP